MPHAWRHPLVEIGRSLRHHADAARFGFNELPIAAADLAILGHSQVKVESGLLRNECAGLFAEWKQAGLSQAY